MDGNLNDGATVPVTTLGITGAAYTNNDALEVTTTGTTLFDINTNTDLVALQAPPNAGTLATTGPLGLVDGSEQPIDVVGDVGFDIYTVLDGNGIAVANQGFASLTAGELGTWFYAVDFTSGRATPRGALRPGNELLDIALPLNQ